MSGEKREKMRAIRDEVLALTDSPLHAYRTENGYLPVIGEGSHDASIVFIGEAPGENEAKTGRPFVGAAGKILNQLLEEAGINREEVYITNIVKDRPPKNRDPLPEEIALYAPYLDQQIDVIQPKVIATLGRFSMVYVMTRLGLADALRSIGYMHGKVFVAKASYGDVSIVPLYHPAASIYNQSLKETLRHDIGVLKQFT